MFNLWVWLKRSYWNIFDLLWCFILRPLRTLFWLASKALRYRNVGAGADDAETSNKSCDPRPLGPRRKVERGQREADAGWGTREDADDLNGEEYRVDTADELYCDCDSTWETEDQEPSRARRSGPRSWSVNSNFTRFARAAKDMQNYRHDYPLVSCSRVDMVNLEFYLGKTRSVPDSMFINEFHEKWKDDYTELESVHTFIQWLFPLQEPGVNSYASTLTKAEIKEFLKSSKAKENLLKSYKLMLNFYGIKLCDENTGEVERADNWRERFYNLNCHTHNSLRITRILKCLGTLGFRHYQYPLVHFFLKETLKNGELPRIKESVLNYFMFAVLDKMQRQRLVKFAYLHYEPKDEFVWCPKKIQLIWRRRYASRRDSTEMHSPDRICLEDEE